MIIKKGTKILNGKAHKILRLLADIWSVKIHKNKISMPILPDIKNNKESKYIYVKYPLICRYEKYKEINKKRDKTMLGEKNPFEKIWLLPNLFVFVSDTSLLFPIVAFSSDENRYSGKNIEL